VYLGRTLSAAAVLYVSVLHLQQDVYAFMDRSNFGDLLLKTLMCKLGNLTPFWKVKPFEACKYCVCCGWLYLCEYGLLFGSAR
jgi:hypothetical protein